MTLAERLRQSCQVVQERYPVPIAIGAVLGSGLGSLIAILEDATKIPYPEIPYMQPSTVAGHSGALVLGRLPNGAHGAFLQGRLHGYEGHAMAEVVYPVRLLHALGAQTLVVTNAAGGINPAFSPGDLMLITDHLNLMGDNPLVGPHDLAQGPRFPDMSMAYCPHLRTQAIAAAQTLNIPLQTGVYCGVQGPSYETPAEIRMLARLGADAVGMSTVPEVIAARQREMAVLGISCITNLAAGIQPAHRLSHAEVLETARQREADLVRLLTTLLSG